MPIKVLVISNYRATPTVRPEAEIFIGLQQAGFDIHIMTYGDSAYVEKFKAAGIRVIDWHPQKKLDRSEIGTIRAELQRGQYDIMQLFNGKAMLNGIQAARGLAVKVVLYRGFQGHIHWYDPSIYLKFLHPRVDAILCNSEGVAEHIRRARVFVKPRVHTINKGHRLEWYENIEARRHEDLGLDPSHFYAVCAANNRKMKGIPYLLQAWGALEPDAAMHLLLLGKDMDNAENQKIIARLSPEQQAKIHFLGWRADSLNIVKMADCFVLASLYGESITKSVLEAMSLGKPAVITQIPGNRELIEDGRSGYTVPAREPEAMAKALMKLYHDPEGTKKMGLAARNRIEKRFQSKHSIAQYADFYRDLLSQDE